MNYLDPADVMACELYRDEFKFIRDIFDVQNPLKMSTIITYTTFAQ